jgi:hypothetical protein
VGWVRKQKIKRCAFSRCPCRLDSPSPSPISLQFVKLFFTNLPASIAPSLRATGDEKKLEMFLLGALFIQILRRKRIESTHFYLFASRTNLKLVVRSFFLSHFCLRSNRPVIHEITQITGLLAVAAVQVSLLEHVTLKIFAFTWGLGLLEGSCSIRT